MRMNDNQFALIQNRFKKRLCRPMVFTAKSCAASARKISGTRPTLQRLPFTDKNDLREAYPLGLQAVPDEQVVRIHSSSGTTGTPVIIPYTAAGRGRTGRCMFARCYRDGGHHEPGPDPHHAGLRAVDGGHRLSERARS